MPRSPFQPSRLTLARRLRGQTKSVLAHNCELSGAAISQFESGEVVPESSTAELLALALGCKPEFFFRPQSGIRSEPPFFRSLRSTTQLERGRAEAYATILIEAVQIIERHVELPPSDIPEPKALGGSSQWLRDEGIESLALLLRTRWQVPPGPIANVVRLIESKGAVASAVGGFSKKLDAFSMRTSQRPVVILCSQKGDAARRRFDAAHELGHLVLHDRSEAGKRQQEDQAHRFASALLMPAEEIDFWLPRRSGELERLEEGSKIWGVSMQALLRRAHDLGKVDRPAYQRTMKRMSAMGWRTKEPVDMGPPERPELLARARAALADSGYSLAKVAAEIGIAKKRLAKMLSVPEDRDENPEAEIVAFDSLVRSAS